MWEYQNSNRVYFRGRRGNSDEDTGIGKVVVIGASNSMTSLINTKCTYSIKILNENVFGVQKCELNNDAFKIIIYAYHFTFVRFVNRMINCTFTSDVVFKD